ncbi:MAG TPA: glycosyltransferase [Acidimicrobiales bacterium]|jgi:putative flippase GtrA|nr:glycosyltransferase [Acidimicrobiales bacterium]
MSLTAASPTAASSTGPIDVEIVIPVYNEEVALAGSVRRLHAYMTERFPWSWMITIADNASTDGTAAVARDLAARLDRVQVVHLDQKGRGRALRAAWSASPAAVVAYMDVDLSTDLDGLLPLVAPLISGHSDVAIGTRLAAGARVVRGPKREVISRLYNLILRTALQSRFSDAQCGFKAVRTDVSRQLLPLIEDNSWFFDTELLVLAEHNGMRIHEVPVDWVDDPDSRVDIVTTARDDLKGVWRLLLAMANGRGSVATRPRPPGRAVQMLSFATVGAITTVTFALLFALMYGPLGALAADVVALTLSALANLAANRRYTFAGSAGSGRYYRRGLVAALLPLAVTLAALGLVMAAGWSSVGHDLMVLTVANLTATVVRFRILRGSTS